MPHSLRCKIKKWCYQGKITEKERDRLIQGLDASDNIKKIQSEIENLKESYTNTMNHMGLSIKEYGIENVYEVCLEIVEKYMKEGEEE